MGLLNYSTKKEAEESAKEIGSKLLLHGVADLNFDFGKDIVFIEFSRYTQIKGEKASYKITTKINPVFELLKQQKRSGEIKIDITPNQAKRVAWRIIKRWIEAQLAFVETGMLSFEEVFLSYKLDEETGINLIEEYQTKQLRLVASFDEKKDFLTNRKE